MYQPPSWLQHVKVEAAGHKNNLKRKLATKITVSLCGPKASTLHIATVKKEIGTFRIGKLFYSF